MTREKLQEQYARILLQLEVEAKTLANSKPNSKLYRSSLATVKAAGSTLTALATEWQELHQISTSEPILPVLQDYAGFN